MIHDRERVKQLQRRLGEWNPDGKCKWHSKNQNCVYDQQGKLIELHICFLNLIQVPSEVWQFMALQSLYLKQNQLSALPPEVGNLSALQLLDLNDNQLSALPPEVGNLSALQLLDLNDNQLSALPPEVGNLSALQSLYLNQNQLSALPPEAGNLSALQWLSLSYNQLSALPPEIGNLSALRWLNLNHNQLSAFPAEIENLSSLKKLDLNGNPLQIPPAEIVRQGVPAILAYLRARQPIKIFYCYAHEDKDLRDQIDKHLGVLKRLGQVTGWYDREIQAGTEWKREIDRHLHTSAIILLLISADFVASDYCYGVEMKNALELHRTGQARVLPILLRPVDWQDAPFSLLQMLPTEAKPITQWKDQDAALEDVAKGIRDVVRSLQAPKG